MTEISAGVEISIQILKNYSLQRRITGHRTCFESGCPVVFSSQGPPGLRAVRIFSLEFVEQRKDIANAGTRKLGKEKQESPSVTRRTQGEKWGLPPPAVKEIKASALEATLQEVTLPLYYNQRRCEPPQLMDHMDGLTGNKLFCNC